jgi:hypothetical protein
MRLFVGIVEGEKDCSAAIQCKIEVHPFSIVQLVDVGEQRSFSVPGNDPSLCAPSAVVAQRPTS